MVLMAAIGAAGALGVQWILADAEARVASSERLMPILLGGALGVLSAVVAFMWQDKTGWFRGEDRR